MRPGEIDEPGKRRMHESSLVFALEPVQRNRLERNLAGFLLCGAESRHGYRDMRRSTVDCPDREPQVSSFSIRWPSESGRASTLEGDGVPASVFLPLQRRDDLGIGFRRGDHKPPRLRRRQRELPDAAGREPDRLIQRQSFRGLGLGQGKAHFDHVRVALWRIFPGLLRFGAIFGIRFLAASRIFKNEAVGARGQAAGHGDIPVVSPVRQPLQHMAIGVLKRRAERFASESGEAHHAIRGDGKGNARGHRRIARNSRLNFFRAQRDPVIEPVVAPHAARIEPVAASWKLA